MSKEYCCLTRRRSNGAWTDWMLLGFSPNLDFARQELESIFSSHILSDDRGDKMEAQWAKLIDNARVAEVGDIFECDEHQWMISL